MNRLKQLMNDKNFTKWSVFIIFNAALLCVLFFVIRDIGNIASTLYRWLCVLLDAFWPLILGLILAYLLNPLAELIDTKLMKRLIRLPEDPAKIEKRKNLGHLLSVLLTYIIAIAAVIAILFGFTVMIIGNVNFSNLPGTFSELLRGLMHYESAFKGWIAGNLPEGIVTDKLTDVANSVMTWIGDNISASSVISFFTNISGSVIDVVVGIIVSIYLMKDKQFFLGLWKKFLDLTLSDRHSTAVTGVLADINGVFSKFIRGALLDALIIAILSSIGLSIMGLEGAVFIGVFAGIANVIPYFGPVIGMVPAFLMGLFTDGFWSGALAVIILLVIQQIDCNLIYPKIVGTSTGLHPLMVLLAVSVFGYFGGILGMLLAVPIAGIIQVFVKKWAAKKESSLGQAETENRESDAESGEHRA